MSHARIWLHLAALLAPLAAACLWSLLLYRTEAAIAYRQIAIFGGLGVLAAQMAALLRWRALERRARDGCGAWKTGIGMAALTHLLFGALFALALNASVRWLEAGAASSLRDAFVQALFFTAMSLLTVGAVTFPLTAVLAWKIAAWRRKELADGTH